MKRFLIQCAILLILSLHTACISNQKVISQFVGANQNELLARWGNPDSIEEEGMFTVWVYDRFDGKLPGTTGTKSIPTEADGSSRYDGPKTVKFFINSSRMITRYELITPYDED
ncbi:hypothetical protein [Mongoliitalea lutea]|uniref:Lipoprotein n=1 Tax=Mongoliitalea lutea TaxID=849756 RepID=A0A8J3G498_9BACT|nr:hypothetical protein [Mongoliitalea lutea]GHB27354.1 hypothetical protein GCM10008106_05110 [Mongoliitalea lutea]